LQLHSLEHTLIKLFLTASVFQLASEQFTNEHMWEIHFVLVFRESRHYFASHTAPKEFAATAGGTDVTSTTHTPHGKRSTSLGNKLLLKGTEEMPSRSETLCKLKQRNDPN
jgi:hypothetical protein